MNLPDIVGPAVVNLGGLAVANPPSGSRFQTLTARWVQFVTTGAGQVRLCNGGGTPTASFGLPVGAPYGSQFLPAVSQGENPPPYHLNALNVYVPAGATLSVMYEPFN